MLMGCLVIHINDEFFVIHINDEFFGDTFWMMFFVIHIDEVFFIHIKDDFCDVL